MILAKATFGETPSGMASEDVVEKINDYLSMLQKYGQVCSDSLHAVCDGQFVAYVNLVRPDSALREYHSRYAIKELDALCVLFGRSPSWELLADAVPPTFPDLRDAEALCLFTSAFDGLSPVCSIDTGDRFPAYLIPIDDDERERLFFWSREYNRMDGIWFSSGELEVPAYEQMASPSSLLSKEGRRLASLLETALKKPVYYFLMRYYGRGERDAQRDCPSCGNNWQSPSCNDKSTGFWNFSFRCVPCRLVSQVADSDDESHADIGEFNGPPARIAT